MEAIGQYIMRIAAAAILCGIVKIFSGNKGTIGAAISLMTGLFMTLTVVSPWVNLNFARLPDFPGEIITQASNIAASGVEMGKDAYRGSIKSGVEAYILDKAESVGAQLEVSVTLSEKNPPLPERITLRGKISPYGKKTLSDFIRNDLGIGLEEQIWIG